MVVDGVTRGGDDQRLSYPEFREIQPALPTETAVLAYTYQPFALATGEHAERTWGQLVSANFFDVLEITPALGRAFRPQEEAEGAGPVAVISDAMWRRRFASDPRVLGGTIQVNGQRLTVVGVAPPGFNGVVVGLMLDVWIPLGMQPLLSGGGPNRLAAADLRWLGAYGRVAPPATISALTAGLSSAARELARPYPDTNQGVTFSANSLADAPWGGTTIMRPVLTVLVVVVLVVLAATCVNVSLLLLARAAVRRREMATRLALGAGRWRIVRQLAIESLLLVLAAATAGFIASFGSARLFASLVPPTGFPIGFEFNVNPSLLALALVLSSAAVVLFGLAPALHAASTRFAGIFREESATVVGGGWRRVRTWLVAAQIAGGVALLATSSAVSSGLAALTQADPGFETTHVLLAAVDLSQSSYDPARGRQFIRVAIQRLASVPGVRVATVGRRIPLNFGGRGLVPVKIDGYTAAPGEDVSLAINQVAPGYLDAMQIPLIAGAICDGKTTRRLSG
jgi:predicted permease